MYEAVGGRISRVNILKKDRYLDFPLPLSSSAPHEPEPKTLGEVAMYEAGYHRTRLEGQQLVGEMIPTIQVASSTDAPKGKPTKNTDLLERGSPALFYNSNDSYRDAAVKVGTIVVGAGVITWFVVPLLSYSLKLLLSKWG